MHLVAMWQHEMFLRIFFLVKIKAFFIFMIQNNKLKKKIKKIIQYGETENVEFKKSLSKVDEALISMVAILNKHKFGYVIFGISPNKDIIDLDIVDQSIRKISQKIKKIEPKLTPSIQQVIVDKKNILVISFNGNQAPYTYDGRAYIRSGDEDNKMSQKEYEEILLKNKKSKWDEEICKFAKLGDIDQKKINWYLHQRDNKRNISGNIKISKKNLIENLKILSNGRPTNAGILFFGKYPQKFFVNARLHLVCFDGNKNTDSTIDSLECDGVLWEMVEMAEKFIKRNIKISGERTENFRRIEKFEYPIKAMREAIINALVHRNYEENGNVRVFIFDNRIEVINPGRFPDGVTPGKPKHNPVNALLCQYFYDVGYIEKYGSGIALINDLAKQHGIVKPKYKFNDVETVLIFQKKQTLPNDNRTITERYRVEEDDIKISDRQRSFLQFLEREGRISAKKYREINHISKETAWRDINDLLDKDLIIKKSSGAHVYYVLKPNDKSNGNRTVTERYGVEEDDVKINYRQRSSLQFLEQEGRISTKKYREINNISKETAWRDINDLINKDLIIRKSSGAHVYYVLRK